MFKVAVMSSICGLLVASSARADEQVTPLVASGDWVAAKHSISMTSPPDVCIAANVKAGVAFRTDQEETRLIVIDHSWTLPAGVAGKVKVDVGQYDLAFEIVYNTDNSVSVVLDNENTQNVLQAMDKSASMTITAGTAKPKMVSLSGSTKATNAFRTCAGISNAGSGGGDNPFK